MVKVMATGTFDIYIWTYLFLKRSKKLGDNLVVVVATDSTVRN